MNDVAKILLDYLIDVMYNPDKAYLNVEELPEEFHTFGKGLKYFAECVRETTNFAKALSKGNLDVDLPSTNNEIASSLKTLHASLRHLTWQTEQVSKGDYQQRVDFMGDFSQAFNSMAEQLEKQRSALLREIENRQRELYIMSQRKNLYEMLAGQIDELIILIDSNTLEWLFISRDVEEILKYRCYEDQLNKWIGKQAERMQGHNQVYTTELELSDEVRTQYYSVSVHSLNWSKRNALAFILTDITREKERLNNLQDIASRDTLTRIYNRYYGMDILNNWIDESKSFILCFIDINNLKYVNDRFGHREGDVYIISVANTINSFSEEAVVSRIGGDEFMILAQGWSLKDAEERMEILQNQLNLLNGISTDTCYDHSISYGIIEVSSDNTFDISDLLSSADEKMYEYKRKYKKKYKRGKSDFITTNRL